MSDDDQITRGRMAWQRLQSHQRTAWADWRAVGEALKIGKDAALLAANAKTPHGKIYTRIFGNWLRETGFDEIRSAHRYRLLLCIENIAAIEAWRACLPEWQRNRYNHPDAVWFAHRRAVHGEQRRPMSRPFRPPNSGPRDHGRPIFWPQDSLRRAHQAMLDCRSNDLLKLARVALEAAVRTEADILALLDAHPKQTHQIRQRKAIAAPVVLELTA
jgi:hypothetical protein